MMMNFDDDDDDDDDDECFLSAGGVGKYLADWIVDGEPPYGERGEVDE